MTPALRTARWLTAAATISSATAAYLVLTGWYWLAVGTVYVAGLLAWCAHSHRQHHRVKRARALLAERAARGLPIDPVVFTVISCCGLSEHADGQAHDTDCLRHLAQASDPKRSSVA
ncbi:hypothetical protein [Streptomyces sp. NBC_00063]|uniref:hypothetical protein n=1 Tax=Streptomyces sp. NBC_00063 TaxID=2975638 RepID=UPI003D7335D6